MPTLLICQSRKTIQVNGETEVQMEGKFTDPESFFLMMSNTLKILKTFFKR